jgi:hypothetical protein
VRRQCSASVVRAVARKYARTSPIEASGRSRGIAARNTSAVRSSASGRLPTRLNISR